MHGLQPLARFCRDGQARQLRGGLEGDRLYGVNLGQGGRTARSPARRSALSSHDAPSDADGRWAADLRALPTRPGRARCVVGRSERCPCRALGNAADPHARDFRPRGDAAAACRVGSNTPPLSIDARFSDVYVDLVKEGIDVAIRTGPLRDSTLVARPFSNQELLLFASPSYLSRAGTPAKVADLTRHTGVLFRVPSTGKDRPWQFRVANRNVSFVPPSRVHVDGGDAIVRAAVLGMGLGQVPHYMVSEELARGELVEVLSSCAPPPCPSPP